MTELSISKIQPSDVTSLGIKSPEGSGGSTSLVLDFSRNGTNIVRTEQEVINKIKQIAKAYDVPDEFVLKTVKRNCSYDLKQLQNIDDIEFNKIFENIDYTIRLCSQKSLAKKSLKYDKRLENTYKWFSENKANSGVLDLLKSSGYIDSKVKSLDEVSDEQIEKAMIQLVKSSDLEKAFENFKNLSPEQKKKAVIRQVEHFKVLINNEPEANKPRLFKIFSKITKDTGAIPEGFVAVKASCRTQKDLKAFLNKFTPSDLAFIGVEEEDIQKVAAMQANELNDEENRALLERIKQASRKYKEENADVFASIQQKMKEAAENGTQPTFDEKEQEVVELLRKLDNAPVTGYIVGVNARKEGDNEHLTAAAVAYAEENGIKEEVLEGAYKLAKDISENHPEYLGDDFNITKFNENLKKYIGEDYEKAVANVDKNEAAIKEAEASSGEIGQSDIGFAVVAKNPELPTVEERQSKIELLMAELPQEPKPEQPSIVGKTTAHYDINAAIKDGNGYFGLKSLNFSLAEIAKKGFKKFDSFNQAMFAWDVKHIRNKEQKMDIASLSNKLFTMVYSGGLSQEEAVLAKKAGVSGIVAKSVGEKENG